MLSGLLLLGLLLPSLAVAERVLRAGIYDNPPLSFVDEQGEPQGFVIDLLRHVAQQRNWQITFEPCQFADCLQLMRDGQLSLLTPMAASPERALYLDFSQEPLFLNWARIYFEPSRQLQDILDLGHKQIAVMRGDIHADALASLCGTFDLDCRLVEVDSYDQVVEMTRHRQVDAGLLNRVYGDWRDDAHRLQGSAVMFNPLSVVAGLSPSDPAVAGIAEELDQSLRQLKSEPGSRYYELIDRWFSGTPEAAAVSRLQWLIGGGLLVLLLLVATILVLRLLIRRQTAALLQSLRRYRRTESALRLFARALDQSPVSVIITDTSGRIVYVNSAFEQVSGYRSEEVLGKNPRLLKSSRNQPAVYQEMWQTIVAGREWRGQLCNRRKSGELYWEDVILSPMRNEQGEISHFVGIKEDVTERREYEQRLIRQSNFDALTRLPNRFLAIDRLQQALAVANRREQKLVLMFVDLDDFKKVNDTLGHELGDELLREAAERFCHLVREEDTVARLGGDEFLLILASGNDALAAEVVAEKIISAFTRPFFDHGREVLVTASIGIAQAPVDGGTAQSLMKNAEAAMYLAKEAGGNVYRFFTAELNIAAARRLELENLLHQALRRDEFSLVFQPLMGAHDERVVGAEVLLRWAPEIGPVTPDEFIPLAESTNLIEEIGLWVLDMALCQAARWHELLGEPLRLAVNISPRQLEQPSFADAVARLLARYNLPASALELEITERILLRDNSVVLSQLQQISALGVRLSVDDFGTGYSALSYLKRFPVDTLKIDRSFVRDMTVDVEDAVLVKTIIAMGRGLGLETVAEGVEEPDQLALLKSEGCDLIQGYYYSKPLPADDFIDWLSRHREVKKGRIPPAV